MKRGLKPMSTFARIGMVDCFKNFPDEEGTETKTRRINERAVKEASKTSPMKRGLKQSGLRFERHANRALQKLPR